MYFLNKFTDEIEHENSTVMNDKLLDKFFDKLDVIFCHRFHR
jgi:hypothetical protein